MTEGKMVGWHHRLKGHEFDQALGVGDGHGSLACCSPWGCKQLDTTEQLHWTDWKDVTMYKVMIRWPCISGLVTEDMPEYHVSWIPTTSGWKMLRNWLLAIESIFFNLPSFGLLNNLLILLDLHDPVSGNLIKLHSHSHCQDQMRSY